MLKKTLTLLCLFLVLNCKLAMANCAFPSAEQNPIKSVTIDKSYAPVYDGGGKKHPGCIIKSNDEILGYTSYNYLCNLPANEKINVKLSYGCCDTGSDQGDLVCTVRAKGLLGITSVHGNGVGVAPAEMDVRAIDDLIDTMQGDYIWSYYRASSKLIEYLKDEKYKPAVIKKRPQLANIIKNGKRPDQIGYAANLLLNMGNENDAETVEQIVLIIQMQSVFDDVAIPAIEKAADYPTYIDKIAPVLLASLKRQYYTKNQAKTILNTLDKLGKSLKPYISELFHYEYEWSDRGKHYDFDNRIEFRRRINKLVCDISAEDTNKLSREDAKYNPQYKNIQFTCPPQEEAPHNNSELLKKLHKIFCNIPEKSINERKRTEEEYNQINGGNPTQLSCPPSD